MTRLIYSDGCEGRVYSRPLSLACWWLSPPCIFSYHLSPMSVYVQVPLFIRLAVILDQEHTLLQNNLILIISAVNFCMGTTDSSHWKDELSISQVTSCPNKIKCKNVKIHISRCDLCWESHRKDLEDEFYSKDVLCGLMIVLIMAVDRVLNCFERYRNILLCHNHHPCVFNTSRKKIRQIQTEQNFN